MFDAPRKNKQKMISRKKAQDAQNKESRVQKFIVLFCAFLRQTILPFIQIPRPDTSERTSHRASRRGRDGRAPPSSHSPIGFFHASTRAEVESPPRSPRKRRHRGMCSASECLRQRS